MTEPHAKSAFICLLLVVHQREVEDQKVAGIVVQSDAESRRCLCMELVRPTAKELQGFAKYSEQVGGGFLDKTDKNGHVPIGRRLGLWRIARAVKMKAA